MFLFSYLVSNVRNLLEGQGTVAENLIKNSRDIKISLSVILYYKRVSS